MPDVLEINGAKIKKPKKGKKSFLDEARDERTKPLKPKKILAMVLTIEEAAEVIGVSAPTVRRMCIDGRLVCRKAKGTWLVLTPSEVAIHGRVRRIA